VLLHIIEPGSFPFVLVHLAYVFSMVKPRVLSIFNLGTWLIIVGALFSMGFFIEG